MGYTLGMETQRILTILLPADSDLRATLTVFRDVQNAVSPAAFNDGKPLRAVEVQRVVYAQVKGTLSSQMTITAGACTRRPNARRAAR